MEKWHAFTAYNSQAQYGFGTEAQAKKHCDYLNRNRDINVYGCKALSNERVAELRLEESYGDAFNFDDCNYDPE